MPKLYGERERLAQPKLDTQGRARREQAKCTCAHQWRDPDCPAAVPADKVVEIKMTAIRVGPLPRATLVKLPYFGLLARSKRSYGEWRRQRLERRKAKRAAELQMLKELEHSSESVLRPFWQVLYAVGTFLSGTRD